VHFDHTGGLSRFPDAQIILGAEELGFAKWPIGSNQGFYREKDLAPLYANERQLLEVPAGIDHDVFGDGSVLVISTPGHSPGHLSLVVRLEHGTFILVGDATHTRDAFEREVICPSDADTVAAVRSVKRIKLLRASLRATVIIGHDPEDRAALPVPPEAVTALA
jgi:glyoxylase-like metal-dependent hydrolase (beta-lactamase superfamily II)